MNTFHRLSRVAGQVTRLASHSVTVNQSRNLRTLITRRYRVMFQRSRDFNALEPKYSHRSDFVEWNIRSELFAFSHRISEPLNLDLLKVVFTDESFIMAEEEKRKEAGLADVPIILENNESLAAEGIDLLKNFIPSYTRYHLPSLPEEGVQAVSEYLTSPKSLCSMAKWIGMEELISADPQKMKDHNESIMAKTFIAFVGAIAKERGTEDCHKFIIDMVMPFMGKEMIFELWDIDSRSTLADILSRNGGKKFVSRLLHETGRNTIQATFNVGIFVDKKEIGSSSAETVDEAEEMAAFDALSRMFGVRPGDFIMTHGPKAYGKPYHLFSSPNPTLSSWSFTQKGRQGDPPRLDG